MEKFIRTCQSCGKRQEAKPPTEYKGDTWRDVKCKKCKSVDLDYGSWQDVDPTTLKRLQEENY